MAELEGGSWPSPLAPSSDLCHPIPKTYLKREIVFLQPVFLRFLRLEASLQWVTLVLSQLCSHLPQLILMRPQLLLLQRQAQVCEV